MTTKEKLTTCIEALKELCNPKGAYSMDELEFARNTIKETAKISKEALEKIGIYDPVKKSFKL